jgi:hypothetical protein
MIARVMAGPILIISISIRLASGWPSSAAASGRIP